MKDHPLEPDYLLAKQGLIQQQLVDRLLRYAVTARLLADKDPLGIPANKCQHLLRHQPVIDHHIRLLQLLQAVQGEQASIAGAGPHQGDVSLALLWLIEQRVDALFGCLLLAPRQLACQSLMAKAAPRNGGEPVCRYGLDPLAQLARQGSELAECCGSMASSFPAADGSVPAPRLRWRWPPSGRAVDDGGHDGAAVGRRVHHVAEDLAPIRFVENLLVDLGLVGGGDHQPFAIEQLGVKIGGADCKQSCSAQLISWGSRWGH